MFVHKIHRSAGQVLLAVCDKELLGMTLRSETNFEISEKFYGSEAINEKRIIELAKNATMINAVGNKIVDFLVKNGFAEKDGITVIGEVKHCQVYVI